MNSFNPGKYSSYSSGTGGPIPMTTYPSPGQFSGSSSSAVAAAMEDSEIDLVSYIAQSLPVGVNPNHILLGLGITFAGVVGGIVYWKSTAKNRIEGEDFDAKLNVNSRLSVPEGVLILHQCPRGRRTPCIAPYPLKLETFLRMYEIKYEIDIDGSKSHADSNGNKDEAENDRGAFVTVDLEETQDTQNCVKYICEKYHLDPQKNLDERQKSLERAFLHLLEHHIYWGISLYRWVYDGARSLEKIQFLPPSTVASIPNVCRTVEQAAWFHGIGKKAPSEVVEDIIRDLGSMSRLLADKKYFLSNNQPTELDCTAFAMLAQMYWTMEESPYYNAIVNQFKNLADFCERIKAEYWPDWEECLNNNPVLS